MLWLHYRNQYLTVEDLRIAHSQKACKLAMDAGYLSGKRMADYETWKELKEVRDAALLQWSRLEETDYRAAESWNDWLDYKQERLDAEPVPEWLK